MRVLRYNYLGDFQHTELQRLNQMHAQAQANLGFNCLPNEANLPDKQGTGKQANIFKALFSSNKSASAAPTLNRQNSKRDAPK